MNGLAFEHRSGRLISLFRLILAGLFLLALAVDPTGSSGYGDSLLVLLLAYAALAAAVLAATWNDWWLDVRLGPVTHALDLGFFTVLISLTDGYASPFFGFFIFLVIAAAMRWRTRQAVATSLLVVLLFLVSAWASDALAARNGFDLMRFITRGASVLTVSVMILWFALNQRGTARERIGVRLLESVVSSEPPAKDALLFAAARLCAPRAIFVWGDLDEPWLNILTLAAGEVTTDRVGPEVYPDLVDDIPMQEPFLFDRSAAKLLFETDGKLRMVRDVVPFPDTFARLHRLAGGLAIPIRTSKHEGVLIALDMPGLCADHLTLADRIAEQISSGFERAALLGSTEEAMTAQARLALARDLHDGAVQFSAGLALKVRSLKGGVADPAATMRGLDEMEAELVQQQRDVRTTIEHLRQPARSATTSDLGVHLDALAKRMETQWDVSVAVSCPKRKIEVAPLFRYQLDQIVREAVSNAVRHGSARTARIRVSREDDWLRLDVGDDGKGFGFEGFKSDEELWQKREGPRSLHERVRSMGGFLSVAALPGGSTINLRLPLEEGPP